MSLSKDIRKIKTIPYITSTISLILKLASAPLHHWFINLSKRIQWKKNIILFTWQKLAPAFLVIFQKKHMTIPFILRSAVLGSTLIINKKSIKEIIALSSVFNTRWILLCISINTKILLAYSTLYWTSVMFMILPMENRKVLSKTDIKNLKTRKIFSLIIAVNLAGFPPLMGFIAKWIPLTKTIKLEIKLLPTTILTLRALNTFTYIRTISTPTVKTPRENQKKENTPISFHQKSFLIRNRLIFTTLIL
jgi:NADH:ubiquinone oxidoreductase subunit 2 (subunit N)